jgi:CRISPR/Cas system CMR subunit Cmr6 (Cas7 group RAMP superfamily)
MADVHGALAKVIEVRKVRLAPKVQKDRLRWRSGDPARAMTGINADLLMKRLWIGESDDATVHHLTVVAQACAVPAGLLARLDERRRAAALALARRAGYTARALTLTPHWRLVVGHGEDTAHETSLTMSPTYGVPIIPGSALKGLAASQAQATHGQPLPAGVARLFGTPRPGDSTDAAQGTVAVLDALPVAQPKVVVDVLTPHVKPYYDLDASKTPTQPPAEYHNPVPVRFLAVAGTPFRTWLIGPPGDVKALAALLCTGLDELGIGGKTAAGYGYCHATEEL